MDERQWIDPLGRGGLASRGVVYLLLAWLTVEIALGRTSHPDDAKGAFSAVAAHPLGWVIVLAVGVGLVGLAVWQASIAVRRDPGPARRAVAAGKGLVYGGLAYLAMSVLIGHSRAGSDPVPKRAFAHVWGRVLVSGVGAGIVVVALVLVVKGTQRRYDVDVRPPPPVLAAIGVVGMVGRGLVLLLVGALVVDAAMTDDPAKARGLDGALRTLAARPEGPWLLVAAAVALGAFGLFSTIEARLART